MSTYQISQSSGQFQIVSDDNSINVTLDDLRSVIYYVKERLHLTKCRRNDDIFGFTTNEWKPIEQLADVLIEDLHAMVR